MKAFKKPHVRHSTMVIFPLTIFSSIYFFLYQAPLTGIDDANIYYVYVENVFKGFGFQYNPGYENVEGFTSFLWTIILISLRFLSPQFYILAMVLNFILIAWTLQRYSHFLSSLMNSSSFAWVNLIFIGCLILVPGFIEWTLLSGMESALWTFLLSMCFLEFFNAFLQPDKQFSRYFPVYLILLVLTRPESLFWVIWISLGAIALSLSQSSHKSLYDKVKFPLWALILAISSMAALLMFRYLYFGFWLPNTYYAKVSPDTIYNLNQGFRYLIRNFIQSPTLIFPIALAVYWLFKELLLHFLKINDLPTLLKDPQKLILHFLALSILYSVAIPVYVGGDHFHLLRFFQPFFPLYILFAITVLHYYVRGNQIEGFALRIPNGLKAIMLCFLLVLIYFSSGTPLHSFIKSPSPLEPEFRIAELGRKEGEKFNAFFQRIEKPSVGLSAAGGFAHKYDGTSLDLLGLNLVSMAHGKRENELKGIKNHAGFKKEVFYQLEVDIFWGYRKLSYFFEEKIEIQRMELDPNFDQSFASALFKNIFEDDTFREQYARVIIHDPISQHQFLSFCRKAYIPYLQENNYEVEILTF